jgi:two-component system chemotaxis response regulator CheB
MSEKIIVIGTSFGGMNALKTILSILPSNFNIPILIIQHLSANSEGFLPKYLDRVCSINVKEADEKEQIKRGHAYIGPPNYHMLIDNQGFMSLSVDEKVNYARPSIDVLFESAVDAFGENIIGILLTGANSDGSKGLKRIKDNGGITIVQEPREAEADTMPKSALNVTQVDYVLTLNEIASLLVSLGDERLD